MIAASAVGIFLIPMLYVVLERVREWGHARILRKPLYEEEKQEKADGDAIRANRSPTQPEDRGLS